jgi:hypothetical protein
MTPQYNEVGTEHSPGQLEWVFADNPIRIHPASGCTNHISASAVTADSIAFFAQVELIKSCDDPESNRIIMGCLLRKNVPA